MQIAPYSEIFTIIVNDFFFNFFFGPFRAAPEAYGSSWARGRIRAVAASLYYRHSDAGSEPCL